MSTEDPGETLPPMPEVRQYDDAKLREIVANPAMYRTSLVDDCRRELEIRSRSSEFTAQVRAMDNDKLREILVSPQLYAEELIYACMQEQDERRRVWREEQEKQEELQRQQREQEEKEAAERRAKRAAEVRIKCAAVWKKWRYPVYAAIAAAVCICLTGYLLSNTHRYNRGVKFAEAGLAEKAIGRLSLISNPKFEHYSAAKYLLYKQYLQQGDSTAAADALTAATVERGWKVPEAYREYAHHCLSGNFEPYIHANEQRAAFFFRNSPDENERAMAARIYFNRGDYQDANAVFSQISHLPEAKGYLGLMHLYGLGRLSNNALTAWEYLRDAPDEQPFLVAKGDLSLFARDKDNDRNNRYEAIRQADYYYQIAKNMNPENRAIVLRAEVTRQLLAAYDRHEKRRREYWSDSKWDSYTFDSGSYEGEYGCWGNECGAQGWGCFTWNNDRDMWLGRFVNCKMNGLGIQVSDYMQNDNGGLATHMRISVGQFKNDKLNGEGYFTEYDGSSESGTWKNFDLVKGTKYDLHGQVTETVK